MNTRINIIKKIYNLSLHRASRFITPLVMAFIVTACSASPSPTTFDLSAPTTVKAARSSHTQLAISEPLTVQALDSDRLIVKDSNGSISYLPSGQWADRLPRLVQTRLIQTFENASRLGKVNRPGDRIVADQQLNTEIRDFQIESATGEAVVSVSAKIVNDRTGRIVAARIFSARVPAQAIEADKAALHLDEALSRVLTDIVIWVR